MFPQGFFFDATMAIALLTVAEALVLALVPLAFLRISPAWRTFAGLISVFGRAQDERA
jgi:hypothetical protein